MLCVTITIVMVSDSWTIVSSTRSVEPGSSAEHGSSSSSTSGFSASERAMQRRCCCPPDSEPPGAFRRSFTSFHRPARVRHSSMSESLSDTLILASFSPATTFSPMFMAGNGFGFWKTIPIRRRISMGFTSGA